MEHANILDSNEKGRSFLYGNRSFYCLGAALLLLGVTALVLGSIEGGRFPRTLEVILIMFPFGASGIIALVGCYLGIQGIRLKEIKRWRAVVGFFGNLFYIFIIGLTVMIAFIPQQVEPEMPAMSETSEEILLE